MRTRMIDGKGSMYFVRPQATKFTGKEFSKEMRRLSPTGFVKMSAWMGRTFTFKFAIVVAIAALSFSYAISWVFMECSSWLV